MRIGRIVPTESFDAVYLGYGRPAETLTQVGERSGAVAQRPGHAGRAGDIRWCEHEIEMEGYKSRRCGNGMKYQSVLDGSVAHQ
jgi:hypothetical protein